MLQYAGWLSLVLSVCVAVAGCNPAATDSKEPTTPTSSSATSGPKTEQVGVLPEPYDEVIELPGATVHGYETAELMAKVGGYVAEIGKVGDLEVDIGSLVKSGDILAVLEVPELEAELAEKKALLTQARSFVAQANAAVEQAEQEVEQRKSEVQQAKAKTSEAMAVFKYSEVKARRVETLVNKGSIGTDNLDEARFERSAAEASVVSAKAGVKTANALQAVAESHTVKAQADLKSAEAKVRVAEAMQEHIQAQINYASIVAPFDGVIVERNIDRGSFVRSAASNSGAMSLFKISSQSKLRVVASVPITKASKVKKGQSVLVHNLGGLAGWKIGGYVSRTASALDSGSRMMTIQVDLINPVSDINTEQSTHLKPGMFGSVSVRLKKWESLTTVSTAAIGEKSGRTFVVVQRQGEPVVEYVDVIFNDAVKVGISGNVKAGEIVMASELQKY